LRFKLVQQPNLRNKEMLIYSGLRHTVAQTLVCQRGLFSNGNRIPDEVTAKNADDILCRMNAGTSRIYISTSHVGQGFSDAYRKACKRIAINPKTPKYAAIDITLWLTLTDPHVLALKPATLTGKLLGGDDAQFNHCWKCLSIPGMSDLLHGYPKDGLDALHAAAMNFSAVTLGRKQ
jgi:hypothetical protein